MKRFFGSILATLLLTISMGTTVGAISFDFGNAVFVDEVQEDDVYLMGGNVSIESDINGDLYVAGGSVVISGNISEDLVVAGGNVTILGNINGDVRVAGGQITVLSNIGDDLVVAAGKVDIGREAVIGGTLLSGSGWLTVDGEVQEDIRGAMGMLMINGSVRGDVIVTIQDNLDISEQAVIDGNLNYSALLEAGIPEEVIGGKISFNKFEADEVLEDVTYASYIYQGVSFVAALIMALILVLLFPKLLVKSANTVREHAFKAFGMGVLTMIVGIVGSIVLLITIVGIPLGLIMFALLLIIVYLGKIFAAAWIASFFVNYKKKVGRLKLYGGISLALLGYHLLGLIPYIGWLFNVVLFLIGVGSIMLVKTSYYRELQKKNMV